MNTTKMNEVSIVSTNANLQPVGVLYHVTGKVVEQKMMEFFKVTGINSIKAVRVEVKKQRGGQRNPEIAVYAFFDRNSNEVVRNATNIPAYIRPQMDGSTLKASNKLSEALRGVARSNNLGVIKNLVYAKLDIFRCLAVILNVDISQHVINITEVESMGNDVIMAVLKAYKPNRGGTGKSGDFYKDILRQIDR